MSAERPKTGRRAPGRPDPTSESGVRDAGAQGRWRFSLPYPPSTNSLYATVNGRRVKTQAARDYAELVTQVAKVTKMLQGELGSPPYRLTIHLWAPDRRRRDADNGVKCLQDALLKCTGHDDAEVVELIVRKLGRDVLAPRADVTLEPVEAA